VDEAMTLAALILAAGAARRMGQPKMLLPWGDTTVLGYLLRLWQHLDGAQVVVVCGLHDSRLSEELDRLRFPRENRIFNPAPQDGMFSSIRCAATWIGWKAGVTHWAIALGDQPQLRAVTLRRLQQFAAGHPREICQPCHAGRAGHPVVFPETAFRQLATSAEPTLRHFLENAGIPIARCAVNDPGLHVDLDTPEDYARARQTFRPESMLRDPGLH
jgi:molybdenum cofactor cytidylyltransferase